LYLLIFKSKSVQDASKNWNIFFPAKNKSCKTHFLTLYAILLQILTGHTPKNDSLPKKYESHLVSPIPFFVPRSKDLFFCFSDPGHPEDKQILKTFSIKKTHLCWKATKKTFQIKWNALHWFTIVIIAEQTCNNIIKIVENDFEVHMLVNLHNTQCFLSIRAKQPNPEVNVIVQ